ncbi:hypothetical protein M3Y98_00897700 [Aphelenchoides besseyi]|nr:hypothetical protein M3Y98_00897700 [Aphelenchoides besseyi]KAI6193056.1 hypothetical protein M3Y96_00977800 [Aphelenchoides besseyi]
MNEDEEDGGIQECTFRFLSDDEEEEKTNFFDAQIQEFYGFTPPLIRDVETPEKIADEAQILYALDPMEMTKIKRLSGRRLRDYGQTKGIRYETLQALRRESISFNFQRTRSSCDSDDADSEDTPQYSARFPRSRPQTAQNPEFSSLAPSNIDFLHTPRSSYQPPLRRIVTHEAFEYPKRELATSERLAIISALRDGHEAANHPKEIRSDDDIISPYNCLEPTTPKIETSTRTTKRTFEEDPKFSLILPSKRPRSESPPKSNVDLKNASTSSREDDPLASFLDKHGTKKPEAQIRKLARALLDLPKVGRQRLSEVVRMICSNATDIERSKILDYSEFQLRLLGDTHANQKHLEALIKLNVQIFLATTDRTRIRFLERRRKDALNANPRRRVVLTRFLQNLMDASVGEEEGTEETLNLDTNRCFQMVFQCACFLYFDTNPEVRANSLHLLSIFQQENSVNVRESLEAVFAYVEAQDDVKRVRQQFTQIPNLSIRNMIISRMVDDKAEVRLAAVRSLRRRGTRDEAQFLLSRILEDACVEVQRAALIPFVTSNLLDKLERKNLIPFLMFVANSCDPDLRSNFPRLVTRFFDIKTVKVKRERTNRNVFRVTLRLLEDFEYFHYEQATYQCMELVFRTLLERRETSSVLDELTTWFDQTPQKKFDAILRISQVKPNQRCALLFHWSSLVRFVSNLFVADERTKDAALKLFVPDATTFRSYALKFLNLELFGKSEQLQSYAIRQLLQIYSVSRHKIDDNERKFWITFLFSFLTPQSFQMDYVGLRRVFQLLVDKFGCSDWSLCLMVIRSIFLMVRTAPPFNVMTDSNGNYSLESILRPFKIPQAYRAFALTLTYALQRTLRVVQFDSTLLQLIDLVTRIETNNEELLIMKFRLLSAAAQRNAERSRKLIPKLRDMLLNSKIGLNVKKDLICMLQDQLIAFGDKAIGQIECFAETSSHNSHCSFGFSSKRPSQTNPLVWLVDQLIGKHSEHAVNFLSPLISQLTYAHLEFNVLLTAVERFEVFEAQVLLRSTISFLFSLFYRPGISKSTREHIYKNLRQFSSTCCGQRALSVAIPDFVRFCASEKTARQFARFVCPLIQITALRTDPFERQFGGAECELVYGTLKAMANEKNSAQFLRLFQILCAISDELLGPEFDSTFLDEMERNVQIVDEVLRKHNDAKNHMLALEVVRQVRRKLTTSRLLGLTIRPTVAHKKNVETHTHDPPKSLITQNVPSLSSSQATQLLSTLNPVLEAIDVVLSHDKIVFAH